MTAPAKGPLYVERDLLVWASEVIDAMWYARYHGGENGRAASKRWAEFRACGNKLNEWRLQSGVGLTLARAKEHRADERARRAREERDEVRAARLRQEEGR